MYLNKPTYKYKYVLLICIIFYLTAYDVIKALSCRDQYTPVDCIEHLSGKTVTCKECDRETDYHVIDCINQNFNETPRCDEREVKYLNLRKNQIKQLMNSDFEDYSQLEILCLESNRLTEIKSSTFIGLEKLKMLLLQDNQIETLHSDPFNGLRSIETINLASNKLTVLPSFENLSSLKRIYLGNNLISELPCDTFISKNIVELDLSNNLLTHVQNICFQNLSNLKTLKLENNKLKEFPTSVLNSMFLNEFDLSGNKFECDCQNDVVVELSRLFEDKQNSWRPPTCRNGKDFLSLNNDCAGETSRPKHSIQSTGRPILSTESHELTDQRWEHHHKHYVIPLVILTVLIVIIFFMIFAIHLKTRRRKRPNERLQDVYSISGYPCNSSEQSYNKTIIFKTRTVTVQRDPVEISRQTYV